MADPISNFIQTYMQQRQMQVAQQNADSQRLAVTNQGHVDAANVMQGFMTALSHTNKDNRQHIVNAFADSTGADPALLSRVASTVQDSPELLRQQAANDSVQNHAFTSDQMSAPVLTGLTAGQSSEDQALAAFNATKGASAGPKGQAMYHAHLSKIYTGQDQGEAAKSQAVADLPEGTLQRFATNAGGTTMTAQGAADNAIQRIVASTGQMNAGTNLLGTNNSMTLGLVGAQHAANALDVDNYVKLLMAHGAQKDQFTNLTGLTQKLTNDLQVPQTHGAASLTQALLAQTLNRMGMPQYNVEPQSVFGGIARGMAGAAK